MRKNRKDDDEEEKNDRESKKRRLQYLEERERGYEMQNHGAVQYPPVQGFGVPGQQYGNMGDKTKGGVVIEEGEVQYGVVAIPDRKFS